MIATERLSNASFRFAFSFEQPRFTPRVGGNAVTIGRSVAVLNGVAISH